MRLIRNITPDGKCKYALVRLDKYRAGLLSPLNPYSTSDIALAFRTLEDAGLLEYAGKGDLEEAFTIKLKDINAPPALLAYAEAARNTDSELAREVAELAARSLRYPTPKIPD